MKSPTYITCETVLQKEGVIFQDYSRQTTLVRTNSVDLSIDNHTYHFRKMKYELLLNPLGISFQKRYALASKERAICDMVYYSNEYYFDNINELNFTLMEQLIPFYPKATQSRLYFLLSEYAQHRKA